MKTIIINGGRIEDDFALPFLQKTAYDYLIAVDKGLEFVKRVGIIPDEILGDFDSASQEIRTYFEKFSIPTRVFHPVKDSTDMEIAMNVAIERGSTEIIILGATGSRLDHVLGSIKNLSIALDAGVKAVILDAHNRICMIDKPIMLEKSRQYGKYVSLHACGGAVEGLTLTGFFYNLSDYHLGSFSALGVSNEIVEEQAQITFVSGRLLLMESKD